jgi:hypothetical protein
MIALFVEGVGAIAQACTLPILLSAGIFALAGGANLGLAVVAHTAGLAFMAWARFGRVVTIDIADGPAVVAGLVVAAAALTVALMPAGRYRRRVVSGGAFAGGAVAAAVWQPCVGTELAGVVNTAPADRLGSLAPMLVYVAGTALVVFAIALVPIATPTAHRILEARTVTITGAALGVALGAAMAIGVWGDVVNELLERSSA